MVKSLFRAVAGATLAALILAACTTLSVRSDVNSALIGQVHCNTFAWAGSFRGSSPLRNTIANPLNESRLRAAITANLAAKGWGWGGPGPYAYREGIIAVDVYDAKSRQPLWHASVDQSLYGTSGPEAQKRIDAAVTAIFSKYPG